MIKIGKNDSIVDIIRKIKTNKEKEIILQFPFGHPVLHNYTSLKILKTKANKKDLIIITNDQTAKKIGKRLGIKYSLTDNPDLIEYNYSFFEYFLYIFKNYFREIRDIFLKKGEDNILLKYKKNNGNIGIFISGLLISIFLLIFIFYFAVNKTYIYITPEIEVKTKAKNFIFKELGPDEIDTSNNTIKIKKVEKTISIKSTYATSGIMEESLSKSRGQVVLINHLPEQIDLRANTRLENEEGITYLIEGRVSIPSSTISSSGDVIPGEKEVYVTAKTHDNDGKIVGERGNMGSGAFLSIPGLKSNKDKIYAKSIVDFKGGTNTYEKKLTQIDINNAKELIESKIKKQALDELKYKIKEQNEIDNMQYKILGVNKILKYSNFEVYGLDNYKIGDQIDNFDISATIRLETYAYNKDILLNKLKKFINEGILKDIEEVKYINDDSLRISNVIWQEENPYSIKSTVQIEALYSHNFLGKNNNYVNKLKYIVSGMNKKEAEKILLNASKISDVEIEIRPFFMNNISKIADNIVFKIVED